MASLKRDGIGSDGQQRKRDQRSEEKECERKHRRAAIPGKERDGHARRQGNTKT